MRYDFFLFVDARESCTKVTDSDNYISDCFVDSYVQFLTLYQKFTIFYRIQYQQFVNWVKLVLNGHEKWENSAISYCPVLLTLNICTTVYLCTYIYLINLYHCHGINTVMHYCHTVLAWADNKQCG